MAQIDVAPIIMRDVLLRFTGVGSSTGTGDFEKHVSQVQFDPSSSVQTWKGLTPTSVFSAGTAATWTCTLSYAQDWETTNSLSKFLYDNEGEEIDVLFEPVSGGQGWEATIIVAPGSIGGTVDSYATATVTLGVVGRPELAA